jgi:hypothetical protein
MGRKRSQEKLVSEATLRRIEMMLTKIPTKRRKTKRKGLKNSKILLLIFRKRSKRLQLSKSNSLKAISIQSIRSNNTNLRMKNRATEKNKRCFFNLFFY